MAPTSHWSRRWATTSPARCCAAVADRGVSVVDVGLAGATPEKIRVRAAGQSLLRTRPRRARSVPSGPWTGTLRARWPAAGAVLVSDYGRGMAAAPWVRDALAALRCVPLVWDPHRAGRSRSRGVAGDTERRRSGAARWSTGHDHGGGATAPVPSAGGGGMPAAWPSPSALAVRCWSARWATPRRAGTGGGGRGPVRGRRLLCCCASARSAPAPSPEAIEAAVLAASTLSAPAAQPEAEQAGGGGSWAGTREGDGNSRCRSRDVAGARGGRRRPVADAPLPKKKKKAAPCGWATIVATGGCFDLLHAGHVATLEAARASVTASSCAQLRRLGSPPEGARPAHHRRGRPGPVLAAVGVRRRGRHLRRGHPDRGRWSSCGPTSGSRAATTRPATSPRQAVLADGAARPSWCRTSTADPRPDSSRRSSNLIRLERAVRVTPTAGTVLVTGGASGLGAAVAAASSGRRHGPWCSIWRPRRSTATTRSSTWPTAGRGGSRAPRRPSATAGSTPWSPAPASTPAGRWTTSAEEWERIVAVNLLGTAAVVRAALPYLERSDGARRDRRVDARSPGRCPTPRRTAPASSASSASPVRSWPRQAAASP